MELKIVFTSQRLTSWEEISEALAVASYQLLKEEGDIKNEILFHQKYRMTTRYLERELERVQKAREIIEAMESPQVLPI